MYTYLGNNIFINKVKKINTKKKYLLTLKTVYNSGHNYLDTNTMLKYTRML